MFAASETERVGAVIVESSHRVEATPRLNRRRVRCISRRLSQIATAPARGAPVDLDPAASELRADSRYNRGNASITRHYTLTSDTCPVIVKTEKEGCLKYRTLVEADRLANFFGDTASRLALWAQYDLKALSTCDELEWQASMRERE